MLGEKQFRSQDVPAVDRFDFWRELMNQTVAPLEMSSDHADDFIASMRLLKLGPVDVWPTTLPSMRFQRTSKLIRQSDPELFHMTFVVQGNLGIDQSGKQTAHGPGDLYVVDSSRTYDCHAVNDRGPVKGVGVEVPKKMLAVAGKGTNELLGRRIPGQEGFGALLTQFLTRITTDTTSFQPSAGPQLGTIMLDLLSALFAHELRAEAALTPETRRRSLVLRIRSFIQRNLADPQLTPRAVAAAHHISLSHLHRLFREENTTVAAWIRHQRLERSRREIADPALRHHTIHQIATRWGYTRAADFTRAFRTRYGMPPSDYRRAALGFPN
ncbi:AraC family transcriptional regulator [Streptomyces sp. CB02923]|uniref:helix-turn-helix domain-containing protein n=1 Tax=Streptomyces sp. CB02923 TaxID=1718985 RepID=UPI00093DC68F|nr:helix-turn-helix domain-containing protein [Streptomyces sp. CB02923]OKH99036.1 AraC family transcriptional regulator [Streptomyces sp. CB02923]